MMNHLKLSSTVKFCLRRAANSATVRAQAFVTEEHMALALIQDEEIQKALAFMKISSDEVDSALIAWLKPASPNLQEKNPAPPKHHADLLELMERALIIAADNTVISHTDIFMAMFNGGASKLYLYMVARGVDFAKVQSYFLQESCMSGGDAS